ncbi:hypothetical protein ABEY69_25085 [Priestia filamentosa]|uniref:hypothetical protein n=1 Tax=Priestia filamentosa TaxID=1402861 RepID=UPI003D28AC00
MSNQEMKLLRKQFEILNSFLGGHQDIDSPERPWQEVLEEATEDYSHLKMSEKCYFRSLLVTKSSVPFLYCFILIYKVRTTFL